MTIPKVEVVSQPFTAERFSYAMFNILFVLAFRTLIVWWFFAAWFPELGYTYWQLVLPVFAATAMLSSGKWVPRTIQKDEVKAEEFNAGIRISERIRKGQ